MLIRQLSIFVENKPGGIAEAIDILGKTKVDICALSVDSGGEYGILRMIVDDIDKAEAVLKKEGYIVKIVNVLGITVSDTPGGLSKALNVLKSNNIEVDYIYAFVGRTDGASAVLKVKDLEFASKVLTENGVELINVKNIYRA